ncbi:calmodulin, putative [Plasmodium knowlesi strain H]|uniref:Calmodulin, putative n=1 Tax=Plasmodium knowlesi (strain H) TaxID=5851 RepID=A0A1A7VGI7_PLAKH|nr:calmodulin, putative [Plasmodium knowlesi strain H]
MVFLIMCTLLPFKCCMFYDSSCYVARSEEYVKDTDVTLLYALTHGHTFTRFCSLLGSLLRCSGYNVSLKEIDKIKEKIIENKTLEKNAQVNEKRETEITTNENDGNNNSSNRKQAKKTKEDNDGDDHDDDNNISKMLSDLKNYDNFIELEKQKEEKKKKEEENKNLFSIKEFFRIIQLPNITNETKPSNVLNSFEIFDEKGNGRISIKKLRFILQYLGEPLSNADFDEFFDWIKTRIKCIRRTT